MSNHPKPGSTSMPVTERHGRKGHVPLSTSVPPKLKDDLVGHCQLRGRTMKDEITRALEEFLEREWQS